MFFLIDSCSLLGIKNTQRSPTTIFYKLPRPASNASFGGISCRTLDFQALKRLGESFVDRFMTSLTTHTSKDIGPKVMAVVLQTLTSCFNLRSGCVLFRVSPLSSMDVRSFMSERTNCVSL